MVFIPASGVPRVFDGNRPPLRALSWASASLRSKRRAPLIARAGAAIRLPPGGDLTRNCICIRAANARRRLQIVSSFTATMRIPWPPIFFRIVSLLNVFNFNFQNLSGFSCLFPDSDTLKFSRNAFAGAASFLGFIACAYAFGRAYLLRATPGHEGRAAADTFGRICISRLVLAAHVSYAPLSQIILHVFLCRRVEGVWYLVTARKAPR